MKKILPFLIGITLIYSCSTNNDSNGNSTTTIVPVTPSNLAGQVISTTQINLSWTDNSTNESGFKIERKSGSGTYALVGTVNENIQSFSDTGLSSNTSYTYRVYAYNSAGDSPSYSNEVSFLTSIPTYSIGPNVTDIDGNIYQSITNCNQTWTKQNLYVSKYTDGTLIPQVTDPTQWANLTTGAWCYYNNDPANGAIYGKLYNWYAVAGIYNAASLTDPSLRKKLAPSGWHIPSETECHTLISCLDSNSNGGSSSIAGLALREIGTSHWSSPNTDATNSSGFTGLPGGARSYNGNFGAIGSYSYWHVYNSLYTSSCDTWFQLTETKASVSSYGGFVATASACGYSVRCVKD